MSPRYVSAALVAWAFVISAAGPLSAQGRGPATNGYVSLVGNDTITIERVWRSADSLSGEIVARSPRSGAVQRVSYSAALGPMATVTAIGIAVGAGESPSAPARETLVRFITDSAGSPVAEVRQGGASRVLATTRGAVPMLSLSVAHLGQVVRRARAIGGDSVTVPAFLLEGGRTIDVAVVRRGRDSIAVLTGGTSITLAVDAAGRVLGGVDPARRLTLHMLTAAEDARLSDASLRRDYSAPPGAPYGAEQVTIDAAGGARLAGTLTLPITAARPLPVAVLISGSSRQDRDYRSGDYALFRWLADTLSRRGIAVLRVDDRGVGGSTGDFDSATVQDRANDVRAEIAFLRRRTDIDGHRIALIGLSEGAMLAPAVAVNDAGVAAVVLMAGPGRSGREIGRFQTTYRIAHDSTIPAAARAASLRAALRQVDSAAVTKPWLRSFLAYDPLAVARRVRVPALILQGATDRQVPAADAARVAAAIRSNGNGDVTVRVLPGTNHIFVPDPVGDPRKYLSLPSLRVPDTTLGLIADWTVQHLTR